MLILPVTRPVTRMLTRRLGSGGVGVGSTAEPWTPAALSNLRQYALDGGAAYESTTINGLPLLRSLESYGTYRQPRQGRCYLFDGTDDIAQVTSSALQAASSNATLTVCGWIKSTDPAPGGGIVATGTGVLGYASYFRNNLIRFYKDSENLSFATTISANTWYHLAYVLDGASISFYINGALVNTQSFSNAVLSAHPSNTVRVGSPTVNNVALASSLRDARVYNVAKDATAIANIYAGNDDTTGLLAQYPCNEESGTVGYDVSGNGNHLTLTNITQSTFHATDTGVTMNRANRVGHTKGFLHVSTDAWSDDNNLEDFKTQLAGDFSYVFKIQETHTPGNTYAYYGFGTTRWAASASNAPNSIFVYRNTNVTCQISLTGTATSVAALVVGDVVEIRRTSGLVEVFINGVLQASKAGITSTLFPQVALFTQNRIAVVSVNGTPVDWDTKGVNIREVFIPRNEAAPTLDVNANALTVTGQAPYPANVEVPCITGDGTDVYADLGSALIPATADFELSCWYYQSSSANIHTVVEQRASPNNNIFALAANFNGSVGSAGKLGLFLSTSNGILSSVDLTNNAWHALRITRIGNDWTLYLNGANVGTVTRSFSIGQTQDCHVLAGLFNSSFSQFSSGRIADLRITTGGVTTYFPLQDGPGSSNTNRDLSYIKSDGTYGVVSNAIVNGTVSTIWGNRCPNARDWCTEYGGDIAANGAFLPGQISGSLASDGTAKTLAAGKFGNPYSRINFNPFTAAELNALGLETAYAVTTARQSVSPTDTKFRRTAADGDDRFFTTAAALTGTDKTNAEAYVT